MNSIIQNILVFAALAFALYFLIGKYFFKKSKSNKACGDDDNCGCH